MRVKKIAHKGRNAKYSVIVWHLSDHGRVEHSKPRAAQLSPEAVRRVKVEYRTSVVSHGVFVFMKDKD